jgi:UDP-N-acetylenolpyruvoylglucosamine reductase
VHLREEEPVRRHLPLRGEGTFERWVEVDDEAELVSCVRALRAEKMAIRVIPPFTDALPPDGGVAGVGLRLGVGFERMEPHEQGLGVGASVPLCLAGRHAGFEALARAPGCLADALDEGWIVPAVASVRRLRGRAIEEIQAFEPDPKAIVVSAVLRRGARVVPPRAGQAFREPRRGSLRVLLARAGVAGMRLHGAALALDDAAVLVNRGDAEPRDLRLLMAAVRDKVRAATGVDLDDRLLAPGRGGRL